MPTSKMKKPGPEEPGHPGNPPPSVATQADDLANQPIAGADPFNSTAPDGAVEHLPVHGSDVDTPHFRFSATYSNEKTSSGPNGPNSPENPLCA